MAGSSNFLQFDQTLTNAYSDAVYSSLAVIDKGISIGIADPMMHNKLFYQLSTFVSAFAQVFANKGYTVSDTNISALITVLNNVFITADLWQTFAGDFHSQITNNFYSTTTIGQTNAPTSNHEYYLIVATSGTAVYHLAIDSVNGNMYWEIYNGTTWSSWAQLLTGGTGSVTATMLASGSAVSNIGHTPANKAGDTFTGDVTATSFSGPLTGNVTGNISGSSGSCTGNANTSSSCSGNSTTATTATKLITSRTINGQSFDGSANIANTDYVIAQSLGTNGYRKWNSGFIEQWGVTSIGSSTNITVTLPVSFLNSNYGGTITYDAIMDYAMQLSAISLSTITINNPNGGSSPNVYWRVRGV